MVGSKITATMLYDLVHCPHRVSMDLMGDPIDRDAVNPFVQLLWEKGHAFEQEVIEGLDLPFTNLRSETDDEKERLTSEAMERGDDLIYGGRIAADDLLGEPDLLARRGPGYVAGDIKSGAGEEGATEEVGGKPKKHYAMQLALYTDILERRFVSAGRQPFVWDIHGEEVIYDLDAPVGPTTLWNQYQDALAQTRAIVGHTDITLPALGSICKLCHWHSSCTQTIEQSDDLTKIPELGRSRRDTIATEISTVADLAISDPGQFINGKKTNFPRVGPDMLRKFHRRAVLQKQEGARPYLTEPVSLPHAERELFFDIETDPMRDVCYLHGFVERVGGDNGSEKFVSFFASDPTPEAEKEALAEAWAYIQSSRPSVIYYYSPYERVYWTKLQKRFPDVLSEPDIAGLFDPSRAVDLYHDVVRSKSEWPTRDHSIKTLASYLGFSWRDTHPSGAASIEWYHRWVETGDKEIKQRILDYNEDDCVAMRVLLDEIRVL